CAVAGIYSILADLFLRDRSRMDQRLQEAFRTRERAKSRQTPLFKDFEELRVKLEAEDQADSSLHQQLESMVEQSGLNLTPSRLLTMIVGLGLGLGVATGLLRQSIFVGVVMGLVGACGPWLYVRRHQMARLRKMLEQLPDAFDLMARVIRAGQTMSQALQ